MDWTQILTNSALTTVLTVITIWLLKPYLDSYLGKKGEQLAIREDLDSINRKIEEIRSDFVERNAYLAEKGKTTATKEDVEEINRKIESIRSEYTKTIEILRWQLSKRATMHRLRSEKELDVLTKIWEAAAELRFATQELRPIVEYVNPEETEQERFQRKMQSFYKSYTDLVNAIEKHRPFYPQDIYRRLDKLLGAAKKEMVEYRTYIKHGENYSRGDPFERAQQNISNLLDITNDICEALRKRLDENEMENELPHGQV